jgi:hypothetical protein
VDAEALLEFAVDPLLPGGLQLRELPVARVAAGSAVQAADLAARPVDRELPDQDVGMVVDFAALVSRVNGCDGDIVLVGVDAVECRAHSRVDGGSCLFAVTLREEAASFGTVKVMLL